MKSNEKELLAGGVLVAVTASLCCITPVLGFLAGVGGIASTFSWLEHIRPYLIGFTFVILGFAWYRKLKPRTAEEIACACETEEKAKFTQTKKFLGFVTVFAFLILAFPKYSHVFFPSSGKQVVIVSTENVKEVTYFIKGMTCSGCEETVKNEVNQLNGILKVNADHKTGIGVIQFDISKLSEEQIISSIDSTGYTVQRGVN